MPANHLILHGARFFGYGSFNLKMKSTCCISNMHHIISDFWSFGVMAREITALYTAFIKGKSADLPELPVQYTDYGRLAAAVVAR